MMMGSWTLNEEPTVKFVPPNWALVVQFNINSFGTLPTAQVNKSLTLNGVQSFYLGPKLVPWKLLARAKSVPYPKKGEHAWVLL